jgi:hypothetical protein
MYHPPVLDSQQSPSPVLYTKIFLDLIKYKYQPTGQSTTMSKLDFNIHLRFKPVSQMRQVKLLSFTDSLGAKVFWVSTPLEVVRL